MEHKRQSSFLEQASLLSTTLDPPVTLKDDRGKTFTVDNDMIDILLLMGKQTNKQLELKSVDPNSNKFKINGVDVSLAHNGIKVNGRVNNFSRVFSLFTTNKDVTEKDITGEGNNIRLFLCDINYNRKRGDTKSNRVKLIRRIETSFAIPRRNPRHHTVDSSSEEALYESGEEVEASGLSKANQRSCHHYVDSNSIIETLEFLILETKASHDGLYDEVLDISKQLLFTNIINQEQLDNFDFNYGKKTKMNKAIKKAVSEIREPASQMTISTTKQDAIKTKQQQLAKEAFSRQITKFRRERIIPLFKDETWSADLIDKSSLSKYNNNYKFILTVIDIFTKYAWAIPLKNKSGLFLTNNFKIVLHEHSQGGSEHRKPEKLWVDSGSEFYNKTFKSLLKEYETKLYSTYSDLKAVFIERFSRTLLNIIKNLCSSKAMVIVQIY